ncbi:Hypothetical protein D9617_5g071110 [Elsinoe fawcettii]|nr:Hypothetical protein D9617_5g071110 [Elsinoe fawcettii]
MVRPTTFITATLAVLTTTTLATPDILQGYCNAGSQRCNINRAGSIRNYACNLTPCPPSGGGCQCYDGVTTDCLCNLPRSNTGTSRAPAQTLPMRPARRPA